MIQFLFYTLFFLFGTAVGSFLNVLILRYNTGLAPRGRSFCFSCGIPLRWFELVPVLSFLAQRGRCRTCASKISWQYPGVEFITGALFAATFYTLGGASVVSSSTQLFTFIILLFAWSVLVVVAVYDLRHKIVPDLYVWLFVAAAASYKAVLYFVLENAGLGASVRPFLFDVAAGAALFFFFFSIWFLSRGRAMGLGDAKLALGMGILLGPAAGFAAVLIAFWSGAIVAIFLLLLGGRRFTMKSEVPFAPFLVLGTIFGFFVDVIFGLPIFLYV